MGAALVVLVLLLVGALSRMVMWMRLAKQGGELLELAMKRRKKAIALLADPLDGSRLSWREASRGLAVAAHTRLSPPARSLLAAMRADAKPREGEGAMPELLDAQVVDEVAGDWEVTTWGHFVGGVEAEGGDR